MIKKSGQVTISDENISVEDFYIVGSENSQTCGLEVLYWARARLDAAIKQEEEAAKGSQS